MTGSRDSCELRRTRDGQVIGLGQKEGSKVTGTLPIFMRVALTRISALHEHRGVKRPVDMRTVHSGTRQAQFTWPPRQPQ